MAHGIEHFNIFTDVYEPKDTPTFNGAPSEARLLHRSADNRHLIRSRKYPEGAKYRLGSGVAHEEAFYIVAGKIKCTPKDGEPIEFPEGSLIYLPSGFEAEWEYTPNSHHLMFFWSNEPLASVLDD